MDAGKPTSLDVLLTKMVTQINTATSIPVEYIIPTLSEEAWNPDGTSDKFVLISNFSGEQLQGLIIGGGTGADAWNANCDVTMVVRLDVDVTGRDTQRLVASSLGLLPKWRTLLKGLEQWLPDDGGAPAQALLLQPARCYGFSIRPRKVVGITGGWVQIRTKLQFVFMQDLS